MFVGRYIERGPVSLEEFTLDEQGLVNYFTADGQMHEFAPLDLLALLSCQVPKPRDRLFRAPKALHAIQSLSLLKRPVASSRYHSNKNRFA